MMFTGFSVDALHQVEEALFYSSMLGIFYYKRTVGFFSNAFSVSDDMIIYFFPSFYQCAVVH